ncbi:MAG: alpha-L-arabinofuranosidase C-terminal domain-containing protein [Myxococcales bacterium]|jgi:alpha-N-arabinofuranosidase
MRYASARVTALLGVALTVASCSSESPDGGTDQAGAGTSGDGPLGSSEPCGAGALTCPAGCDAGDGCSVEPMTGSDGTAGGTGAGAGSDRDGGADAGSAGSEGPAPVVVDCDEAAIGTSPNTLTVDVAGASQAVHREIFGVLLEILGNNVNGGIYVGTDSGIPNTRGIRNDIIEGFKEAGVGAIQWPGGCAANHYDWQANLNPPNTMGTDLFMDFCQWVEAEPYLVGRPRPEFAQSNRDWVEYVNDNPEHPEWNLKYFKVGNEVWGCGGDLGDDNATYESWYDAHHDLLSTPVNGKELFLVGATGGIWTVNPDSDNWLTRMLSPGHLADRVDGIEIHDYLYFPDSIPSVGFSESQYYEIVDRANEGQIAPRLRDIETILDRYDPEGRIKIMEDEWGDWLIEADPSDIWMQHGTLMDGISAAEHLHVFMQHADRVLMGGLAQSTNVIHSLFLTNSSSGGTDLVKTPTFYVFELFVPHHTRGARLAPQVLSVENIDAGGRSFPVLSSTATVNDAGEVHVSLVNVDLAATRNVTVTVDSAEVGYTLDDAQVITGPARDSHNDFGVAETVNIQPLDPASYEACGKRLRASLPPRSVVMFSLTPLAGGGDSTATGCPAMTAAPSGECTPWGDGAGPELCSYGETRCVCQAGQQGASWVCGSCPASVADGDECAVTGLACGDCVCETSWLAGGQRDWAFTCPAP